MFASKLSPLFKWGAALPVCTWQRLEKMGVTKLEVMKLRVDKLGAVLLGFLPRNPFEEYGKISLALQVVLSSLTLKIYKRGCSRSS